MFECVYGHFIQRCKGGFSKGISADRLIIVASRARKYESTCSSVYMDTSYRDAKGVGPLTCIPLGTSNREWSFYRVITNPATENTFITMLMMVDN